MLFAVCQKIKKKEENKIILLKGKLLIKHPVQLQENEKHFHGNWLIFLICLFRFNVETVVVSYRFVKKKKEKKKRICTVKSLRWVIFCILIPLAKKESD